MLGSVKPIDGADQRSLDPGSDTPRLTGLRRRIVSYRMPSRNVIGEYLRARRELLRPGDVGLRDLGRRHTPGLRREEVAMLAGVSADYYIRLEQGRDHHPSAQVLDALARVLQLDADATAHLHGLAQPPARRSRRSSRRERPPAATVELMMSWPTTPAYIFGRYLDVLAANPLATALAPWFTPGENLLKGAFLDPRRRELRPDWQRSLPGTVAALRANVGPDIDDPRLTELVGELSLRSEDFRQLWARHDARPKGSGTTVMLHPQVGRLELSYTKFPIPDTDRQTLSIYHAAPGSSSERALALLATMTVREREPERTLRG
jgi:transcriptional regulator with XRE-family HTH domain